MKRSTSNHIKNAIDILIDMFQPNHQKSPFFVVFLDPLFISCQEDSAKAINKSFGQFKTLFKTSLMIPRLSGYHQNWKLTDFKRVSTTTFYFRFFKYTNLLLIWYSKLLYIVMHYLTRASIWYRVLLLITSGRFLYAAWQVGKRYTGYIPICCKTEWKHF